MIRYAWADGVPQPRLYAHWLGRHYGHQALEFLEALLLAKQAGAELCYLRPRHVASETLYRLACPEVAMRRVRWCILPLKPGPIYYPRRLFRERIAWPSMRLPGPAVAFHVREGGYKWGHEVQNKRGSHRDDTCRNASIGRYHLAAEALAQAGYTIVRLGDATMTPIHWTRDVDLAVARPDPTLELATLCGATFLVATESGPAAVSYLTNTPCLTTNATDPVGSYPIRADGLLLLKHVYDRQIGRELPMRAVLGVEHVTHIRDSSRYRYLENTPEELLAAVHEMATLVRARPPRTPAQARVRDHLTAIAEHAARQSAYVRKWGPDRGFLGDGRLVSFQAEAF